MPLGDCGGMFTADGEQARRHRLSPSVKGPAVDASLDPISWGRRSWSEFKSTKWEVTANMCRVSQCFKIDYGDNRVTFNIQKAVEWCT